MLEGKKILPTRILIRKLDKPQEKKTQGGLFIPTTAESMEVTNIGEVILVGEGTATMPMVVKVGNHVLFPPRAPQRVETDDGTFYLLSLNDVLLYW